MTICKYYQQGNCRFGNRCWNEHTEDTQANHQYGNNFSAENRYSSSAENRYSSSAEYRHSSLAENRYSSSAEYRHNDDYYKRYHYYNPRYSPPPPRSPFSFSLQKNSSDSSHHHKEVSFSFNKALTEVPTTNKFAALSQHAEKSVNQTEEIEFIKDDMKRWELGKQWPFSCYAPVKVCLPGFKDISPEELRWQYYGAKESGTLPNYLQTISEYAEEMKLRRNELKSASPQVIEKLRSLQTEEKQQNFTFRIAEGTDFKISDDNPTFGNSRGFTFSLSNGSEQSKSPFRLHQFGDHNEQRNMFGNSSQTAKMETSIFDVNGKENEKRFSQNSGSLAFALSSPFAQQKDYSVSMQNSTGLSNKFLGGNDLETTVNDNEMIYTDLKMLDTSEKEEYTSNKRHFILGSIPTKPPPKEICF